MFSNISAYNRVVISGPQRSGTRIAAKIVAQETGKTYIDEQEVNFHDFRLLEWYLQKDNLVIQCPGLCHKLHEINTDSTIMIMVFRPIDEIIASEKRVNWPEQSRLQELYKYGYSSGIISRIKYEFWDRVQRPRLAGRFGEINFHELADHPMFVIPREHFRWDQTT